MALVGLKKGDVVRTMRSWTSKGGQHTSRRAFLHTTRYLLDWFRNRYAKQDPWLRGIFEMIGAGKEDFAGVDPDEYVRQLRQGW